MNPDAPANRFEFHTGGPVEKREKVGGPARSVWRYRRGVRGPAPEVERFAAVVQRDEADLARLAAL